LTLDLTSRRELGALFGDSLRLYFGNFARFVAIGAAVVVPTQLIVSGIGLGRLSGGFEDKTPRAGELIGGAVQTLVSTPLIVAMTVYLLLDLAAGKQPSARRSIQAGLDAFAPIFLPVVAALACEAAIVLAVLLVALLTGATALTPLLVGAVFLAVRWYFVAQSVVVDNARGLDALRASWSLTRGFAWRVLGTVALGYLAFVVAATVLSAPLASAAHAADSGALRLAAEIVAASLAAPAVALLSALLYFDLRARSATAHSPPGP
jgi:hypothetical protein